MSSRNLGLGLLVLAVAGAGVLFYKAQGNKGRAEAPPAEAKQTDAGTADLPESKPAPVQPAPAAATPLAATAMPSDTLMRVIEPVRLPAEAGAGLDAAVASTRDILQRFRVGGFDYAVWAVSELPAKPEDIEAWTRVCLQAFPARVIVALDTRLDDGRLPEPALKAFLAAALPRVHSVMVNYADLSNCSCAGRAEEAIAAVRRNIDLAKSISPKVFVWLHLDDCDKSGPLIPQWTEKLGSSVDGFFLARPHGVNAVEDPAVAAARTARGLEGKPVVRGSFVYSAPRVRPGIEADLAEQYRLRLGQYEAWLRSKQFSGYSRELGKAVPDSLDEHMALLPARM